MAQTGGGWDGCFSGRGVMDEVKRVPGWWKPREGIWWVACHGNGRIEHEARRMGVKLMFGVDGREKSRVGLGWSFLLFCPLIVCL